MSDLLQTGAAWLEDQRTKFCSHLVSYQRANDTVDVLATVGKTVFRIEDGYGAVIRTESRDYLIRADDLILSGQTILPERGDKIRESDDAHTFVYEVLAPGDEPHFRYSDPNRQTLRIHTKFCGAE